MIFNDKDNFDTQDVPVITNVVEPTPLVLTDDDTPEVEDICMGEPDSPSVDVPCISEDPKPEAPQYTLGGYFGTLQEAVVITWRYHLKTRKHYIHVELDSLYSKLIKLVDSVIEQTQADHGVITDYYNCVFDTDSPENVYFRNLRGYIIAGREYLFGDGETAIWSTIDEIISELNSIIYKLETFNEEPIQTFESYCYENYHNFEDDVENELDEEE